MYLKRLIALAFVVGTAAVSTSVLAAENSPLPALGQSASLLLTGLPVFAPATQLAQSALVDPSALATSPAAEAVATDDVAEADVADDADLDSQDATAATGGDARQMLLALAMKLKSMDIHYRRGGKLPSTGFDCSGFVHYVFRHSIGLDLPANSARQFLAGFKVKRADMQTGDLVFFRTRGKRISHVGIYIDNGRFIHSPSTGKVVRVDSLNESYWSRHFAGAKRPEGIAKI
jgi:cell wall-associated NlpC family hydrolase